VAVSALASLLLLLPPGAAPRQAVDSLAARQQVRLCASAEDSEQSLRACRSALELGLNPGWSASIRRLLARKLATLLRWGEVADVYGQLAQERPDDADVRLRLGSVLLFGLGRAEEAEAALRAATRLRPDLPEAWAALGAALNALGRYAESEEALAQAQRLEPGYMEANPASGLVYDASRRKETWPRFQAAAGR
jgi:Flp pilus assembly protein TadD